MAARVQRENPTRRPLHSSRPLAAPRSPTRSPPSGQTDCMRRTVDPDESNTGSSGQCYRSAPSPSRTIAAEPAAQLLNVTGQLRKRLGHRQDDSPTSCAPAAGPATAAEGGSSSESDARDDIDDDRPLPSPDANMSKRDEVVDLTPFLGNDGGQVRAVRMSNSSTTRRLLVSLMPRKRTLTFLIAFVVLASQAWIWSPSIVGEDRLQAWGEQFDKWRPSHLPFQPDVLPSSSSEAEQTSGMIEQEEGFNYLLPIGNTIAGTPIYAHKMTLPPDYQKPIDRSEESVRIQEAAFPPSVVTYGAKVSPAKAVYKYPDGDPHAGVIPASKLATIDRDITRTAPVEPSAAPSYPADRWSAHGGWSRSTNGSKTRIEDALDPDSQPEEHDWRPFPFNTWTRYSFKDKFLRFAKTQPALPKVQHSFAAPYRFSGMPSDVERDNELERRRRLVRNAFLHSWEGYKEKAWGHDEVRPVSGLASDSFNGWGATIVDALDTLLVMELQGEYEYARQHVRDIDFYLIGGSRSAYGGSDGRVPVFETAIRYLGGFLSAFDLSGDELMRDRAEELAQLLMPAFETKTGVPVGRIAFDKHPIRPGSSSVIFSEAGSLLLEMTRLWQVTGNRTYFDRVHRITDWLQYNMTGSPERLGAMLPATLFPDRGTSYGWYSWGGMVDSSFEYLVKEHQLLGGRVEQYGRFFADVVDSAHRWLLRSVKTVPDTDILILGHSNGKSFTPKLEHLACFAGGSIGLGAKLLHRPRDLDVAARLSESCWWAYNATETGIGPEDMSFYLEKDSDRFEQASLPGGSIRRGRPRGAPVVGVRSVMADYRGRPETIESVFYMWRLTGDRQWQERGWQMFCSWITHSLAPYGLSSLGNVLSNPTSQTDSMESYVFAETFKYYYLLFSPPDLISLDDYVFTTEAHPILLPKNGQWAKPASGPRKFWDESLSRSTLASSAGKYVGGEGGQIGGLTRIQKSFIYETWQNELLDKQWAEEQARLAEAAAANKSDKDAQGDDSSDVLTQVKRILDSALKKESRTVEQAPLDDDQIADLEDDGHIVDHEDGYYDAEMCAVDEQ